MIVGINYENPLDTNQRSVITFGSIMYDEIEGGADGLTYHPNLAQGKWGLLMDLFSYNKVDLTTEHFAKIAFIDSGNFSLQIPASMHFNLKNEMKKHDSSIFVDHLDGQEILASRKSCSDLEKLLKDIEFTL
jgi:hypothetical protein